MSDSGAEGPIPDAVAVLPVLPVAELDRSLAWYGRLGFTLKARFDGERQSGAHDRDLGGGGSSSQSIHYTQAIPIAVVGLIVNVAAAMPTATVMTPAMITMNKAITLTTFGSGAILAALRPVWSCRTSTTKLCNSSCSKGSIDLSVRRMGGNVVEIDTPTL